jgi:hypothetical protein
MIGVPMKRDYLVILPVLINLIWQIKSMNILEKYDWFSPKKLNINYFTDQTTILYEL